MFYFKGVCKIYKSSYNAKSTCILICNQWGIKPEEIEFAYLDHKEVWNYAMKKKKHKKKSKNKTKKKNNKHDDRLKAAKNKKKLQTEC